MTRKVIYPFVSNGSFGIQRPFPGDYSNDDVETVSGSVISDYDGTANQAQLPDYQEPQPVAISVLDITGPALLNKNPESTVAIIKELTDISIRIAVDLPDNTPILIPLMRRDTGRIIKAFGTLMGGEVTLDIQIPTAGEWYCDTELVSQETLADYSFTFTGIHLTCVL